MVYATLRHELLDLAVNVAGPMPTGMDLDRFETPGGQDALGSQAWFDSLPDDLQGLLDEHWKPGADDDEGDDLDALRKGGGKKGGGRAPKGGGRTPKGTGRDGRVDDRPACDMCKKPGHKKVDCGLWRT